MYCSKCTHTRIYITDIWGSTWLCYNARYYGVTAKPPNKNLQDFYTHRTADQPISCQVIRNWGFHHSLSQSAVDLLVRKGIRFTKPHPLYKKIRSQEQTCIL